MSLNAEAARTLADRYLVGVYKRPDLLLTAGEGVWLIDAEGKRYLDAVAGIAVNALGYGDPELVRTLQEAAEGLWHVSNLYHTAPHLELARDLVERSFADRVYFANSGTEAVEAAVKFARAWARRTWGPGKTTVVAFTGSFHGRTMGSLALTHREKYQAPFRPLMGDVRFAPFNDLEGTARVLGPDVCAVIVEPIQGEGGIRPARPEFLRGLRELCDRWNALLIFDEIQCGLGRTGHLWAHQAAGVTPDLMTLAKPLGGGLPIGVTLTTEAVARTLGPGDHGSTFAGGPLVTAVARKVLERVADPAFLEGVRRKGAYLEARLREADLPGVREIRGRGLMWGVEIEGSAREAVAAALEEGLLVVNAGDHVIRLVPPLIIDEAELEELVRRLKGALARIARA